MAFKATLYFENATGALICNSDLDPPLRSFVEHAVRSGHIPGTPTG